MLSQTATIDSDKDVPFQFWKEIYDDIERCIVSFFSIQDLESVFTVSKKFNKMMTKLIYNESNYNQNIDSVTILPAIKQAILVQNFRLESNNYESCTDSNDESISGDCDDDKADDGDNVMMMAMQMSRTKAKKKTTTQ